MFSLRTSYVLDCDMLMMGVQETLKGTNSLTSFANRRTIEFPFETLRLCRSKRRSKFSRRAKVFPSEVFPLMELEKCHKMKNELRIESLWPTRDAAKKKSRAFKRAKKSEFETKVCLQSISRSNGI